MLHKLSAIVPLYRCGRWHLHVPDHNTAPSSSPIPPPPHPPTSRRHQTPGSLEPSSSRPAEFKCTQVYPRFCTPGLHDERSPKSRSGLYGVRCCLMSNVRVQGCPGLSSVQGCLASIDVQCCPARRRLLLSAGYLCVCYVLRLALRLTG